MVKNKVELHQLVRYAIGRDCGHPCSTDTFYNPTGLGNCTINEDCSDDVLNRGTVIYTIYITI